MTRSNLGVDGAPGGWLVAERSLAGTNITLEFHESLQPLIDRLGQDVDVIAIDMPIGLSSDGNRPVDALVRERLGVRRSTFFPTPIRSVLAFDDYAEANAHAKATVGAGLSKQAWNLVPKIRELDNTWRPGMERTLIEAHPETCFAEMAASPVLTKKSTSEGRLERVGLLHRNLGANVDDALGAVDKKWRVDAVDALALLWTACRAAAGEAIRLGGELDAADRPMQLTI